MKMTREKALEIVRAESSHNSRPYYPSEELIAAIDYLEEQCDIADYIKENAHLEIDKSTIDIFGGRVYFSIILEPQDFSTFDSIFHVSKKEDSGMKKLIKYVRDEDEKTSTDTKLICPKCGTEVSDADHKCPECGVALEDPDDTTIIR